MDINDLINCMYKSIKMHINRRTSYPYIEYTIDNLYGVNTGVDSIDTVYIRQLVFS